MKLYYSEGCDLHLPSVENLAMADDRLSEALYMIEKADVTILCVGLNATIEGEEGDEGNAFVGGDKRSLELPEPQQILIDKALSTGKPVILVLAAGSSLNAHSERAASVLQAWYPGETGGTALANILFGKVSPSGKLPVTFYETVTKLPDFMDYSMKNRTYRYANGNILYPFGYGLTYSTVGFSDMQFDGGKISITISNTGSYDTDEVIQVYIRDLQSPYEVLNYRLCGVKRVSLKAGAVQKAEITLDKNAFTVVDNEGRRVPGSGKYQLWCGVSQPDPLSEKLTNVPAMTLVTSK